MPKKKTPKKNKSPKKKTPKKNKSPKKKTEVIPLIPKTKALTTDIAVLEKAFEGDKEMVLFFLSWMKHDRNATAAYLELHPDVTKESAAVMGSLKLRNIKIEIILESYGIGPAKYLEQLKEGLEANRKRAEVIDRDKKGAPIYAYVDEPDHKIRRKYHESLGKMLGFEKLEQPSNNMAVQINNQNLIDNTPDDELDDLIA